MGEQLPRFSRIPAARLPRMSRVIVDLQKDLDYKAYI
jgi:hypothetical protein